MSVKTYQQEYAGLNMVFDEHTGESKVWKELQDKALEKLDELGLLKDVDSAKIVDLEQWKLGKTILRKKGTRPIVEA
jgi:arginyl-tRNA synthetase